MLETHKFFEELLVIFIILLFLILFNTKYIIKLEFNIWDSIISKNIYQKQNLKKKVIAYILQEIMDIERNYMIYDSFWY